jgi:hypothetical protein
LRCFYKFDICVGVRIQLYRVGKVAMKGRPSGFFFIPFLAGDLAATAADAASQIY